MQTITLHSKVGADGVLKLQVPVKLTNTDLEVVLIVQPVASTGESPGWLSGFFEEVAGGWKGERLVREDQGEYEVRQDLE